MIRTSDSREIERHREYLNECRKIVKCPEDKQLIEWLRELVEKGELKV